jgi:hypothetical protein
VFSARKMEGKVILVKIAHSEGEGRDRHIVIGVEAPSN